MPGARPQNTTQHMIVFILLMVPEGCELSIVILVSIQPHTHSFSLARACHMSGLSVRDSGKDTGEDGRQDKSHTTGKRNVGH